jgi:hypothetical protein
MRYTIRTTFHAPLDFVYRWCTDYSAGDAQLEGEAYERRILRRTPREVVYQDLSTADGGWSWTQHVVRLLPPDRWHSESVGSHREITLDYRLRSLAGERTQLTLTAVRRPCGIGTRNPSKSGWEASVRASWRHFGRALEREYRGRRSAK